MVPAQFCFLSTKLGGEEVTGVIHTSGHVQGSDALMPPPSSSAPRTVRRADGTVTEAAHLRSSTTAGLDQVEATQCGTSGAQVLHPCPRAVSCLARRGLSTVFSPLPGAAGPGPSGSLMAAAPCWVTSLYRLLLESQQHWATQKGLECFGHHSVEEKGPLVSCLCHAWFS